jgi:CubicO group peptidase (beta-lactamase class C family)
MTATLIAKYIEKGNLTWDSTLEEVLPQWRERMEEPYRNVTIAQLASHHSGFTDGVVPLGNNATFRNATAVDGRLLVVQEAFRIPPVSPPEQASYSNQN